MLKLANTGLNNLEASTSLADPMKIVQIALAVREVPFEDIVFVQYPTGADYEDPNKVVPNYDAADQLWAAIEANAQPAAMSDIRWHEELLRVGVRQERLNAVGRCAPDRESTVAVVVRQHHQKGSLATNEKGGRAMAQALAGLGEGETDLADSVERLCAIHYPRE
jgi:hypothetical protein